MIRTVVKFNIRDKFGKDKIFEIDRIDEVDTSIIEEYVLKLFGDVNVDDIDELWFLANQAWYYPRRYNIYLSDDIYVEMLKDVNYCYKAMRDTKRLGDDVKLLIPFIELYKKRSEDVKYETMYNMMYERYQAIFNDIFSKHYFELIII